MGRLTIVALITGGAASCAAGVDPVYALDGGDHDRILPPIVEAEFQRPSRAIVEVALGGITIVTVEPGNDDGDSAA